MKNKLSLFDKMLWNEIIIQFLKQTIIPRISQQDYKEHFNEIAEQLIGEALEHGVWEL